MKIQPKFCPSCGGTLESRSIDGHPLPFCPTCDVPVYQNSPPLAACLLMNDRREVLLVKRTRGEGQSGWSLPLDFVHPGEPVAQAAGRILQTQTGLDSRPCRLIDADTTVCQDRGDLLIVTMEMEKIAGHEIPGPNIETLGYFPHSRHPHLAFEANDRAIRRCVESHQEEWMIGDSFQRLQNNDDRAMLSDALLDLIRDNSQAIAAAWFDDVRNNPTTASFAKAEAGTLQERVTLVLSHFSSWLGGHSADREVADFYRDLGHSRRAEGFRNQEILSALMLLKKHTWKFILERGCWQRPIDVYRLLELNRRIVIFFDKAMFHATRGYEEP